MSKYTRQEQISGWRQNKLSNATVIVVGVGALGNEVARIIALSGVGKLILCDNDKIELSNLNRCGLFREADIGSLKVDVASHRLQQLSPKIKLDPRPYPLIHGIGLAELRDADLVISCLDTRAARLQLAGRCNLVNTPYLDGATYAWGGEIRPFLQPETGACYGCSLDTEARSQADMPWSCQDTSPELPQDATAGSSILIASWMSILATRFLMELPVQQALISVDTEQGTTKKITLQRDENCLLHTPINSVTKITLNNTDTILSLKKALAPHDIPLVWEAVQNKLYCTQCQFKLKEWALPSYKLCPDCGVELQPDTTLELLNAPDDLTLKQLGIAPREILAVRGDKGIYWIELSGD